MSSTDRTSQEERNKGLIRSFIQEIFELSTIDPNDSVEGSPQAGKGGGGFKQFLTDFFKAFPDWQANIEHVIAENELVVIFLNGSGTQKGEFHGIPPTNKPVNIRSADLYRIEGGIITGLSDVVDQLKLLNRRVFYFRKK